jgi:hypothetical protein
MSPDPFLRQVHPRPLHPSAQPLVSGELERVLPLDDAKLLDAARPKLRDGKPAAVEVRAARVQPQRRPHADMTIDGPRFQESQGRRDGERKNS